MSIPWRPMNWEIKKKSKARKLGRKKIQSIKKKKKKKKEKRKKKTRVGAKQGIKNIKSTRCRMENIESVLKKNITNRVDKSLRLGQDTFPFKEHREMGKNTKVLPKNKN
jgi:seryl-tRNA synthetase